MSTGVIVIKRFWILLCLVGSAAHAQEPVAQSWTLKQLLVQVRQSNRDVLTAQRLHQAAQADQRTASVTPSPVLSINTQQIDPGHLGHGSLWARPVDTVVRVDQPLERGGKAHWRTEVAQLAEQASAQDLSEAIREQVVQASQAYWDLKLAQEQWRISVDNETLAKSSSGLARLRLAQGDLSRLDATRLEVEAQRAANERESAAQQVKAAQATLARLVGREGVALTADDAWPTAPTAKSMHLPSLSDRADVLAATRRVEQARAALSLAESQRSADVTVGLQFEHDPPSGARWWGVGVSIPLGVDGRQDGPVQRARIDLATAEAELERIQAQAQAERSVQLQALETAARRVERIEQHLLPQAREAAQSADYARKQGALSLQDVLDARRTLHAAELDAEAAHADLARALAALGLLKEQESEK
ncbi:MAG TPA: TolC family protein [Aquabacterium sp.]|nr:TolC family protein [Aquabacterium sp.]